MTKIPRPVVHRARVVFVWHGLPAYGARLIRGAINADVADIEVVATRPGFSTDPVDQTLPGLVQWHHADERIAWSQVPGGVPDILISTGWGFPFCQRLSSEAARAGVPVVMMSDNRWRGDIRQMIGKVAYRLLYQRTFSAGWVPGDSAARVLREFGVPNDRIFACLYGCDPGLFSSPLRLSTRDKSIVFVGQMIRRKGVDVLIEAFVRSRLVESGWRLLMFGSGPMSRLAHGKPGIFHREFSPPEVIARAIGSARIFAMPSRDDNWPLALHEGTAAGCLLLTTTAVGSNGEFVGPDNGMVVTPGVVEELRTALLRLAAFDDSQLDHAEARSVAKASHFGPASFARVFEQICTTFANRPTSTPC